MKLPNVEKAFVTEDKIKDYLLSETHPDGRAKAAFFTNFGFSAEQGEILVEALLGHAHSHEVASASTTSHGIKFVVESELITPDGRNPKIRTVWIIEVGKTAARLITAYPLESKPHD